MARKLYISEECRAVGPARLYLDGRPVCSLQDGAPSVINISDKPHNVQIRFGIFRPCFTSVIQEGSSYIRLSCSHGFLHPKFRITEYESFASPPEEKAAEDEPSVFLIRTDPSRGDLTLDTLRLFVWNGKPTVFWSASSRGGISHATGSGDYLAVPPEMLPFLTAGKLTEWMLGTIRKPILELADFPALAGDSHVASWCSAVRKAFASLLPDGWFRFPVTKLPDVHSEKRFRCPCGRNGIIWSITYDIVDDADPEWGVPKPIYHFSPEDPCFPEYEIVGLDEQNDDWILKKKQ